MHSLLSSEDVEERRWGGRKKEGRERGKEEGRKADC